MKKTLPLVLCILLFFSACNTQTTIHIQPFTPEGSGDYLSFMDEYDFISRTKKELIEQWYWENDGTFSHFYNSFDSWRDNKMIAKAGVDMGKSLDFSKQKRSVSIAIIDTGFDDSHIAIQREEEVFRASADL